MMSAEHAISRFRRARAFSAIVRLIFGLGMLACVLAGPMIGASAFEAGMTLFVVGMVWLILSARGLSGVNSSNELRYLIATGQWDVAEERIERSLQKFSLFRTPQLISVHQLALLRHAQSRYAESAVLCQALLGQRLSSQEGLSRSSRMILAEALLETGDVRGVHDALSRLHEQRLSLAEAVQLLVIELDYQSRIGAWAGMMANLTTKVQLVELMPSDHAAKAQAMLALAARNTGRMDWSDWLRRRAELLVTADVLVAHRPILRELFPDQPLKPIAPEQTINNTGLLDTCG